MNMVGKIVLSIKQKGLMQQQQQHQHAAAAAAAAGGGGPGWTGMEMRQMGTNMPPGGNMLPNMPPGGGGYPSFPPGGGGGHMPPYGGVMGQRMMSYPGPPPPQQQMMHTMPPHNMGVTMRPFNMMNRAHPPPQRASLATNMPGSGEQVVSAVPNPSFPAPAATGEIQHPPGAPSPFTNHPSPYHAPPSVPPPSSVPPPQSSAQPAQANSPKPPQSVPSPRVSHPIPSPGTPWNPNSPSNTASPSQPPPPSNQPSLTPEGSNAVLLKLQELQCYIPLLARMIDRLQRGNEKDKGRTDQLTKLTSLYNVLQSKNMKVPLQTLEKCHIALKRIFEKDASITSQPPPAATQAPPQSQPTTTSTATVTTNVETSNNAVTTTASSVTPPRPPVPPTPPLSASMSLLDFKILHSPPPLSSYLQPLLE
ncbi:PREDICTED: cleavage and polyadenylation specificity factor subunit 6-like, partial [Amphimedon queenslandica]|uniref:ARC105/Med15 mediator subunit central domain-containing protein n=1 Tax=Amphimedon queenslandica TaxID=400682 RepID=A0A1X7SR08_AMPQE